MSDASNIALRAYELWDEAGRPEGRADEFHSRSAASSGRAMRRSLSLRACSGTRTRAKWCSCRLVSNIGLGPTRLPWALRLDRDRVKLPVAERARIEYASRSASAIEKGSSCRVGITWFGSNGSSEFERGKLPLVRPRSLTQRRGAAAR